MPSTTEQRLNALEADVSAIKTKLDGVRAIRVGRPGPEPGPCIKGNDPTTCAAASVHQYQSKCRGQACIDANTLYYAENRDKKAKATPAKKAVAKEAVAAKKVTSKKPVAAPVKKVAKKVTKKVTKKV